MKDSSIKKAFCLADERYEELGVDVHAALKRLESVSISINCWQGDDVRGFERQLGDPGGGLQVTGSFPGRARTIEELRMDLECALSMIPGDHRVNLHAIYGNFSKGYKDRDSISKESFSTWVSWAKKNNLGLDFNATCFAHPNASDGWTLCNRDETKRTFWVEHVKRCREIAEWFGKSLNKPSVHNLWIPDGCKDLTVSRYSRREILKRSLDEIYESKKNRRFLKDSIESKLFGIGSESFVAGSYEFYLSWMSDHNHQNDDSVMPCLDMGHFHPTESVADKISSLMLFNKELLIHVSRGVRWDSDHVVVFDENLRELMLEIVRTNALDKTNISLDYFDASMNRIGAWVIGARATLKSTLNALLEPRQLLEEAEKQENSALRLAIMEELRSMPLGAIWDFYCLSQNVEPANRWFDKLNRYEKDVLLAR